MPRKYHSALLHERLEARSNALFATLRVAFSESHQLGWTGTARVGAGRAAAGGHCVMAMLKPLNVLCLTVRVCDGKYKTGWKGWRDYTG